MPRDRVRIAALALVVLALGGLAIAATPSRAAETTYTGVVISDEGGLQRTGSTVTVQTDAGAIVTDSDGWAIRVDAGPYRFRFSPGAEPYALGTYEANGVNSATDVGMSVEQIGSGCGRLQEGTFTLLELPDTDVDRHLTRFAADLVWRCIPYNPLDDPARWLHASIRIGASTPPGIVTAPMGIALGTTTVGATNATTVTLSTMGDGSTTLGAIDVEGPDSAMVAITDDHCSQITLAADSTCSFDVAFSPTTTQAKVAHIRIHGSAPVFDHLIRADGRGRSPLLDLPSELVVNGDEEGWVIDGAAYRFTGADVGVGSGVGDARGAGTTFPGGRVSIAAPDPDVLAVGHYVVPPFDGEPIPFVGVDAFGHGCNWATGSFDVLEPPIYDTDGSLLSVAFDFEHHCEGAAPRVRGSVRLHTTLPAIDLLPPTGSVEIEGGDTFTGTDKVSIHLPAEDPSGVDEVRLSNDGISWATRPYASSVSWSLSDPAAGGTSEDGEKTVYVRWRDGAGNTSFGATGKVVLDTQVPTVTAPRRGFNAASTVSAGGAISTRLPWTGADDASGIASYELAMQVDAGPWTALSSTLAVPTLTRNLTAEHTYRFRVRAKDEAGNLSPWATGATFRVSRRNENNRAVTYSGAWSTATDAAYLSGAARYATAAGAKVSTTFAGRTIAWIARPGPGQGIAEVYVNGSKVATIDLQSASTLDRRAVWVGAWSTVVPRTVTIKVLGTPGRPRVDFDAFITADDRRGTCVVSLPCQRLAAR